MQLAVISDLHLGAGGAADQFGHSDLEFSKLLDLLEGNFERIVLLGDIWETLTGTSPGGDRRQLRAAREQHPEIARRFETDQYIYVHGNHDSVAAAEGVPDQHELYVDKVRIIFSHGHLGDPLIVRHRWLSELGVWLGAWVCRVGWRRLYQLCSELDARRGGALGEGARCVVRRWAEAHAGRERADIIVTGHTHVPARAELDSCLFMNSGSCAQGRFQFLSLDTGAGNYQLHGAA